MTETGARLLLGAVAGLGLGSAFYLGLWATIVRAGRATRPWRWFVGSLVLRLVIVGTGFMLLARGGPWLLVGALVGFAAARPLITHTVLDRQKGAE